jgi:hypothetical protein
MPHYQEVFETLRFSLLAYPVLPTNSEFSKGGNGWSPKRPFFTPGRDGFTLVETHELIIGPIRLRLTSFGESPQEQDPYIPGTFPDARDFGRCIGCITAASHSDFPGAQTAFRRGEVVVFCATVI